jgi:hypothetical protein
MKGRTRYKGKERMERIGDNDDGDDEGTDGEVKGRDGDVEERDE